MTHQPGKIGARRLKRAAFLGGLGLLLLLAAPLVVFDLLAGGPSRCFGRPSAGHLDGAVRPPAFGANYRSYCLICVPALRTYGHRKAIESLVAAYGTLAKSHPATRWVYGEIGWPWGGRFPPHRTHRNGLSVDFMVPLTKGDEIATHLLNRFGYDAEFDSRGQGDIGQIDFDAVVAHLLALDRASRERGGAIARVILAPDLQDELFAAEGGVAVATRLRFNTRPAWVRHDDHYHVDFAFPCEN